MEKKTNLWVIPTDKPSRLHITSKLMLYPNGLMPKSQGLCKNQHIYITSNEEIKQGDLYYDTNDNESLFPIYRRSQDPKFYSGCKKIILTTDQDLIKYGVQAIDDEFLEWFVKNPKCEFVEVEKIENELISPKNPKIRFNYLQDPPSFISAESLNNMILTYKYKIIILKEEAKKETLEESVENKCVAGCKHYYGGEIKHHKDCVYYPESFSKMYDDLKWQQEQDKNKYSEEEVRKIAEEVRWRAIADPLEFTKNFEKWFEQFKNK